MKNYSLKKIADKKYDIIDDKEQLCGTIIIKEGKAWSFEYNSIFITIDALYKLVDEIHEKNE